MNIERPRYESIPLATGLKWRGDGGFHFSEKMDGIWSTRSMGQSVIVGEQMRDGRFFAFDIAILDGQDIRRAPFRDRLDCLNRFSFQRPAAGVGGEFLETVLARGGEGVVATRLDGTFFDSRYKCKRTETFDLLVTDKCAPSIRLSTIEGENRGWCCARAAFDEIRIGQIVEVAAYSLTASGKLREPRFVRIRHDKMAV